MAMISLHSLTFKTFGDKLDYVMLHANPKEEFPCVCIHFLYPMMCTIECSMRLSEDGFSYTPFLRYVHSPLESQ